MKKLQDPQTFEKKKKKAGVNQADHKRKKIIKTSVHLNSKKNNLPVS